MGEGDKIQTFDVHESLITGRSLFFKKAVSGTWREAQDRLVNLPEDEPATFRCYLHLLYTNTLAIMSGSLPKTFHEGDEVFGLVKLYVLAEKLQDVDTKNIVLEATMLSYQKDKRGISDYVPKVQEVRIVYTGTTSGSPMRKLLVDLYTYRARLIPNLKVDNHWPSDFVQELLTQVLATRGLPPSDFTTAEHVSRYLEGDHKPGFTSLFAGL